ncbi:lysosomal dipeptide transporter MFSD1-like [Argopecten irradians]|uniref:lysosomal dipeptide transporter MFSD1-like n=1 Tax=Argopecten irradians TaxID=31199 RepID=UPI003720E3AC
MSLAHFAQPCSVDSEPPMMTERWRYGVIFCNSFLVFGVYYFMEIPTALQNEMLLDTSSLGDSNNTGNDTESCTACLGLGEVRYNLLFSFTRWTSVVVSLPSGILIDRLGNKRSSILFSTLVFVGSVLFAIGATSEAPISTPMYVLMVLGYGFLAFGDGSLRVVQARVVSFCFPNLTFIALGFSVLGYCGQGLSLYITPIIGTVLGLKAAVWLDPASCLFGVICAIGLVLLLKSQPQLLAEDYGNDKVLVNNILQNLPGAYWLSVASMGLFAVGWLVKQANLPEFLELQHGYTMTDASHITGIAPVIALLSPVLCFFVNKAQSDGIVATVSQAWMVLFYVILGFAPAVNILIVTLADGIGIGILTAMTWQLLVLLCPAEHVGTLGGLMYSVRNALIALAFIATGYILQRHQMTDTEDVLLHYKRMFITLITLSSMGVLFGIMMNVLDYRKDGALNARLSRWQNSSMENIKLISRSKPPNDYDGHSDIKESVAASTNRDCNKSQP